MECTQIILAFLSALFFFLLGMAGSILPALPGAPLVFVGVLLYGLITDFSHYTVFFILGQAILALSTFALDYIASVLGVKRFGGSSAAVWGAIIGVFVGVFIGPWGLIIGPVSGAVLAEFLTGKKASQAIRSGLGGFVGFLLGTLSKLLIAGIMIAWFLIRVASQLGECIPWI